VTWADIDATPISTTRDKTIERDTLMDRPPVPEAYSDASGASFDFAPIVFVAVSLLDLAACRSAGNRSPRPMLGYNLHR
jgi:hypothetical protein